MTMKGIERMENKYIRKNFNGLTSEVKEWDFLQLSTCLKEEFRKEKAEMEIASAYMHAAEVVFESFNKENNPVPGIKLFRNNQMCMPMLFLCRHTIELTIKIVIENITKKVEKGHELQDLWDKLKSLIEFESNQYDDLIDAYKELDDNGLQLRYVKDLQGKEYKVEPYFVKADLILEDTKKLYNYLLSLLEK